MNAMNATNQPDSGAKALEASAAQRDDLEVEAAWRRNATKAHEVSQDADPCDKRLFCRLPSPLQLALLYRLHASVYRQPRKFRAAGRRSNG